MYQVSSICTIIDGVFLRRSDDQVIQHLVHDSRRIQQASSSLFFAITSPHNNGHRYVVDAWKKGVRNFVVSQPVPELQQSNVILVKDVLPALQQLAAHHRSRFSFPVIGITGSNGKTTVKEWLYQMLKQDYQIVRSPKSFNSQIGVPLSVWQMSEEHDLAIIEAGISCRGEMEHLLPIISPTIGILTNIGDAHAEGFSSRREKEQEKSILFSRSEMVISPGDDPELNACILNAVSHRPGARPFLHFTWGKEGYFRIESIEKGASGSRIQVQVTGHEHFFTIPFTDDASIENAITCCCTLMAMGYEAGVIQERLQLVHPIDMRLQLKHSFNNCIVINDSYSADVHSLEIALDFMKQQSSGLRPVVILSEFVETGRSNEELYRDIAAMMKAYGVTRLITVGSSIGSIMQQVLDESIIAENYISTDDFIMAFRSSLFSKEIILVKGARKFGFENIALLFEEKKHQTVLEINLNALAHNLKQYQGILEAGTRIMAMVKAFSYGSGGAEIASVLQFHNIDFLGVAYADEGVDLVKAGISLPVMVMNAEASSFQAIVDYNLQPVIYSYELFNRFSEYIRQQGLNNYPVHLEFDTGMNRLGFSVHEAGALAEKISMANDLQIISVFSHLAASESKEHDEFTWMQARLLDEAVSAVREKIAYDFIRHIANSAAIVRHPALQMDMVRLGIGLYGIEVDDARMLQLQPVATLRSTIAQLRTVKKGETISYNRKGRVDKDSRIATVRIGYADGYSRQFGNGRGKMMVRGTLVPVTGVVCMDMTMIDVSDVEGVQEGDDVIIFGEGLPVQEMASWAGTIPYEIMTSVSQRVKRIYFHE